MAARILVCFRQMFCIHLVKIPVKEPLHLVAGVFNSEKVEVLFFEVLLQKLWRVDISDIDRHLPDVIVLE
jgi:hypothetical protein